MPKNKGFLEKIWNIFPNEFFGLIKDLIGGKNESRIFNYRHAKKFTR